jgi:hypothetical protein
MKTLFTIELEVEHDGSSSEQELSDGLVLFLESGNGKFTIDNPDDFGVYKSVVEQIFAESVNNIKPFKN